MELCGDAKVDGSWQDSWRALEQLVHSGKVHSLGVLHSFTNFCQVLFCFECFEDAAHACAKRLQGTRLVWLITEM